MVVAVAITQSFFSPGAEISPPNFAETLLRYDDLEESAITTGARLDVLNHGKNVSVF